MKRAAILLSALVGVVVGFPADPPKPASPKAEVKVKAPVVMVQPPARASAPAPKRFLGKPASFGGLAVQVAKSDQPLQWFNPLAPAKYGDGSENVDRHPRTGRPQGFRLFSISF
jgi:hypothetical protein